MTSELGAILQHVEELAALDTTGVPPTMQVVPGEDTRAAWRPDIEKPGLSHEDALAAAPHVSGDGFAVPAFVEG